MEEGQREEGKGGREGGRDQIKSSLFMYTAYFHKIQGCLQYKTMYVKIKIKLNVHIIITNIYIIKQS